MGRRRRRSTKPGARSRCEASVAVSAGPVAAGSISPRPVSTGPVALVTGASAGIGLETVLGLARAGFRVIMAGRDRARTERARTEAAARSGSDRPGGDRIETALADFASLAEVRALAETVLARHDRLDLLVNN